MSDATTAYGLWSLVVINSMVFIIFAFRNGGSPTYVMPIVFGFAPLVNVLTTMIMHPPKSSVSPLLYLGFLLTAAGAGMVLYFRPQS